MDAGLINLLANIKGLTVNNLWKYFLLGLFRFAPIIALAPFLGSKLIPTIGRALFMVFLTLIFMPIILFHAEHKDLTTVAFLGLSIKELLIGYIIGFFVAIPFYIVQSTGIVIDYMRGSSQLMSQDPTMQTQTSSIGILFNFFLIVIFFQSDAIIYFYDMIATSYLMIPVDSLINPKFFNSQMIFWQQAESTLGYLFETSLQLGAPCILAILMAEMFLGIANRLAPQVQIAFLGMALKSLLGLILLWSGWFFILKHAKISLFDWLKKLTEIIHSVMVQ